MEYYYLNVNRMWTFHVNILLYSHVISIMSDIIGFMTDLVKTTERANLTDKEIGILLNVKPDVVKRLMDGKQRLNKTQDDIVDALDALLDTERFRGKPASIIHRMLITSNGNNDSILIRLSKHERFTSRKRDVPTFIEQLQGAYLKYFRDYAQDDGFDDLKASYQDWMDSLEAFNVQSNDDVRLGAILALLPVIAIRDDENPGISRETAIASMLSLLDYDESMRPRKLQNKLVRDEKADDVDEQSTRRLGLTGRNKTVKALLDSTDMSPEMLAAFAEAYESNDDIDITRADDKDEQHLDIGGRNDSNASNTSRKPGDNRNANTRNQRNNKPRPRRNGLKPAK